MEIMAKSGDASAGELAVWLYPKDSLSAKYFSYSHDGDIVLSAEPGEYTARAVTNLPAGEIDFSDVDSNLDYLERDGVISLSEMTEGTITAIGSKVIQLEDGMSCSIPVTRCAAKVSLEKITNSIARGKYAGQTVTVTAVSVINGVGMIPLDGHTDTSIGSWFHCSSTLDPGEEGTPDFGQMYAPAMSGLTGEWSIPCGQSLEHMFSAVTGPNDISDALETSMDELAGSTIWTPRRTKLTVTCDIAGDTFHYTIPLEEVRAGTWYKITELELLHQGSKDPDKAISFYDATMIGEILSWDGKTILETI